jgi:tRNA(adenine34) deaminase
MNTKDEYFIGEALKLAEISAKEGEVPVGALVVKNNEIIACGRNRREIGQNALYHAEMEAINGACKQLSSWRLCGCEIFVTLEPCPMCAGAIINSRLARLVFGAYDPKSGSCGSVVNLFDFPYNHLPEILGGICNSDCSEILSKFFKQLRE